MRTFPEGWKKSKAKHELKPLYLTVFIPPSVSYFTTTFRFHLHYARSSTRPGPIPALVCAFQAIFPLLNWLFPPSLKSVCHSLGSSFSLPPSWLPLPCTRHNSQLARSREQPFFARLSRAKKSGASSRYFPCTFRLSLPCMMVASHALGSCFLFSILWCTFTTAVLLESGPMQPYSSFLSSESHNKACASGRNGPF